MCSSICTAWQAGPSPIGKRIESFALDNCYGKPVAMSDFDDRELIAVVFLGTECPLAKLYGRRLAQLQTKYAEQGVTIIGINSNKHDSMTELLAYQNRFDIPFPMLKDVGNRVADVFGASRTPEVFLLDRQRVIRYHGRIDDQYGVGYSREAPMRNDLAIAIDELLAGKDISSARTDVVGCHIGRVKPIEPSGEITFTKHIAPILNARCVSCHREGEIAPFTLTSYKDVMGWEDTIIEVIDENRMPPWFANPEHGRFANDARLSERERELIVTWIDNGMPEGDAADLPEPPQFVAGWKIPEPDQVIQMRKEPFTVPAQGVVDYQRFVVDPGWDEDKYIVATEARPQNVAVVHHILAFVIPPGKKDVDLEQVLAGYAPGSLPVVCPDGVAVHVKAGSKLLFELHYTPNGTEQTDLSYVGVCFTEKEKVQKPLIGRIAVNTKFQIPAHDDDYEVRAKYKVQEDEALLSMTPHMHLRGKAFRYEARFPNGEREVLLDIPRYDFNWQLKYVLAEPKKLPRGTVVECTAWYDNSGSNLSNPDPGREVGWGDQSWDEMMIGFMETVPTAE
ncbi:redoxin domain-containing protein [Stieleria varia]|uniref:redoxin domain-containing protein n=1 Tax=Stieleria varia TaxID=2528005 RepID=UPI001E437CED|nr:redoxin domain-containing protein [Stieleria varia]